MREVIDTPGMSLTDAINIDHVGIRFQADLQRAAVLEIKHLRLLGGQHMNGVFERVLATFAMAAGGAALAERVEGEIERGVDRAIGSVNEPVNRTK